MASTNPNTALTASTPNVKKFDVMSPTMQCAVKAHFDPTQWTPFHKTAWETIQNALPNLSEKEREEVCDRWIHITRRKGKGKVKCPTLEAVEKLALYCMELQANRFRVNFGKQMRAVRKFRRAKTHHTKGGYTQKMADKPRKVPVDMGAAVRTRGAVQRDKGTRRRAIQKAALLQAKQDDPVEGDLYLSDKVAMKWAKQLRGPAAARASATVAALGNPNIAQQTIAE